MSCDFLRFFSSFVSFSHSQREARMCVCLFLVYRSASFTVHFSSWSIKNFNSSVRYVQMALVLVRGVDIINVSSSVHSIVFVLSDPTRDIVRFFLHSAPLHCIHTPTPYPYTLSYLEHTRPLVYQNFWCNFRFRSICMHVIVRQ